MSEINLNTPVRWSKETLFRDLGEQSVVVCLKTSTYFGLEGAGARIWELIGEEGRVDRVLVRLVEEYDIDEATAEADLLTLVGELARRGLVETT